MNEDEERAVRQIMSGMKADKAPGLWKPGSPGTEFFDEEAEFADSAEGFPQHFVEKHNLPPLVDGNLPPAPQEDEGPGFWSTIGNRAGELGANVLKGGAELFDVGGQAIEGMVNALPYIGHTPGLADTLKAPAKMAQEVGSHGVKEGKQYVKDYVGDDPSVVCEIAGEVISELPLGGPLVKGAKGAWPIIKQGAKLIPLNVGLVGARESADFPENPTWDDYMGLVQRVGAVAAMSLVMGAGISRIQGRHIKDIPKVLAEGSNTNAGLKHYNSGAMDLDFTKGPTDLTKVQAPSKIPSKFAQTDDVLPQIDEALPNIGAENLHIPSEPTDIIKSPRAKLPQEANDEILHTVMRLEGDIESGLTAPKNPLYRFLYKQGGMQDDSQLRAIGLHETGTGSHKLRFLNKKGMSIDEAAEKAAEAGFIESNDPNLLYAKLHEELQAPDIAPQWFEELTTGKGAMTPQRIERAIEKIKKDAGLDVGSDVERVKTAALDNPQYMDDLLSHPPSAADEAMQHITPDTLGETGGIKLPKVPGSNANPNAYTYPGMEETLQAGKEALDEPSMWMKAKEAMQDFLNGFRRTYKDLPETPKFSRAKEELMQVKLAPQVGTQKAGRVVKGIVDDLDPNEFDIMDRIIPLRDAAFDLSNNPNHMLPGKWTPEGVAFELNVLEAKVAASPKIQRALQLRQRVIAEVREELVKAKILTFEEGQMINEQYFPHYVRDYAQEMIDHAKTGSGWSMKKTKPGYAYMRKGTNKLHNFNYLEAESAYLQRAYTDLETHKIIKAIQDDYDILPKVQKAVRAWNAKHPDDLVTWGASKSERFRLNKFVDEQFPGNAVYQVEPTATFFSGFSSAEDITDKNITGVIDFLQTQGVSDVPLPDGVTMEAVGNFLDKMRPGKMLGAPKAPMIVPNELKTTLEKLGRGKSSNWFQKAMGGYKEWLLIAPHKVMRYRINNNTGDFWSVWAGNSDIITDGNPFRWPSVGELWKITRNVEPPTKDYLDASRLGVIDTGQMTMELTDPNNYADLQFIDPRKAASWPKMGKDALKQMWGKIRKYNSLNENMLRYAAYKHYKKALDAGKKINYGASRKEMVDALGSNEEKAAKLSRELLGDYINVSEYGQVLSKNVMMFYRWMEVNMTRYNRIIQNAGGAGADISKFAATGKVSAVVAGKATVKVATMYAKLVTWMTLVSLWNNAPWNDDEEGHPIAERLPQFRKDYPNPVMPEFRDENGNPRNIRMEGAFADMLHTLGYSDIAEAVILLEKGNMTLPQAISQIVQAPARSVGERAFQGSYPHIIGTMEYLTGKKYFPDMFNPADIHNVPRHFADKFALKHGYDLVSDRMDFDLETAFLDTFSYGTDAQTPVYETKGEVNKFVEGRQAGEADTKTMLYDWKRALITNNQEKIDELEPLIREYVQEDPAAYKRAMDSLDPQGRLGKTDKAKHPRSAFDEQRTEAEARKDERGMKLMRDARQRDPFYEQTLPKQKKARLRYRRLWEKE